MGYTHKCGNCGTELKTYKDDCPKCNPDPKQEAKDMAEAHKADDKLRESGIP